MTVKNFFKLSKNFAYLLSLLLVIYLRFRWSTVSQWREDSATNIWLAYTKNFNELPVGLLSSKMVPNPNGIILIGKIFTTIESVLHLTFVLSLFQVFLFFLLSREISSNKSLNNFTFLVLSFSTIISASSVEFWNNWILILPNTLFFIFLFKYLNTTNSKFLLISFCLLIVPSSIYLAGISNSIIYFLLIFIVLFKNKNYKKIKFKIKHLLATVFFYLINFLIVWNPYFKSLKLSEIFGFSGLTTYDRVNIFSDTFLELPGFFITFWTKKQSFYINHIDITGITNVHTRALHELFKIYVEFHKVIIVMFIAVILFSIRNLIKINDVKIDNKLFDKLFLFFVFIIFSALLNPIIGGPNFVNYERVENMNQYYQYFLIIWLCTPFLVVEKFYQKKLILFNNIVFSIFLLVNILLSLSIFTDSLNYDGDKLIESDVPLIHKIEAVDYIGSSILEKNSELNTTISYDLGGGTWNWIPSHGEYFSTWYKDYPFTIGRIFDYQLLRKYSIKNDYEGFVSRDFIDSDYIISYKFEYHEALDNKNYEHEYFGRLRVSKLISGN